MGRYAWRPRGSRRRTQGVDEGYSQLYKSRLTRNHSSPAENRIVRANRLFFLLAVYS